MGAVRGAGELEAHRFRHPLGEDFARLLGIELQVAADQMRGVEVAEDQAGVGDGRVLAAAVVAHRAGLGARALGPHPQRAGGIDPDLGAAAGPHLGRQRLGADDAGGGAGLDDIGRQPGRHFRGRETAVRLHQQ